MARQPTAQSAANLTFPQSDQPKTKGIENETYGASVKSLSRLYNLYEHIVTTPSATAIRCYQRLVHVKRDAELRIPLDGEKLMSRWGAGNVQDSRRLHGLASSSRVARTAEGRWADARVNQYRAASAAVHRGWVDGSQVLGPVSALLQRNVSNSRSRSWVRGTSDET